jgi:hypothetical protein
LSTWRLCHQPHSITPNKGIETISIGNNIHILYSSFVFRSFTEAKRPITINIIAPQTPAAIIIYCDIPQRDTLPKNNVPNINCPMFIKTFPVFSIMSVFLSFFLGFFSFPMPALYRF